MNYIKNIEQLIGNTPMIHVDAEIDFFAKLEGRNPFGSVKDRAAKHIINAAMKSGDINNTTEIIESSSGNFAIALAGICNHRSLQFTCVVDPLLTPTNRSILTNYGANIVTVQDCHKTGHFITERLSVVYELLSKKTNTYWPNQYENYEMQQAYYCTLAPEILADLDNIDYIFIAVSTCGTIAGVSRKIKEKSPNTKVIAVDVDCSSIFQNATSCQHIPGMGTSIQPGNLRNAIIDDIVIVSELECVNGCRQLLKNGLFVGASSGGIYTSIQKYFQKTTSGKNIAAIFPDCGERYINTIYNDAWCIEHISNYRHNNQITHNSKLSSKS